MCGAGHEVIENHNVHENIMRLAQGFHTLRLEETGHPALSKQRSNDTSKS